MVLFGIIISVLTSNFIMFDFLNSIYDFKNNQISYIKTMATPYIIFTLVIIMINLLEIPVLNISMNYLIFNLISYLYYKYSTFNRMIILNTIFFILLILIDVIVHPLIKLIASLSFSSEINYNFYNFLAPTIFSIISLFAYRLIKTFFKLNKHHINIKHNIILSFFLPCYSMLVIYSIIVLDNNMNSNNIRYLSLLICLGLIFFNIYLIKLYEYFYLNNILKTKLQVIRHSSEAQLSYYENLSRKNTELNHYFHDVQRHLQMIKSMYESNQPAIATDYIKNISDSLHIKQEHFKSSNVVLEILIIDKIIQARDYGVTINAIDTSDGFKFIDNIDLVIIFSNLIDNAIDSAKECTNKNININIFKYNEFSCVTIKNHFNTLSKGNNGSLFTTKNNHSGYGLEIISNVVKKYNGSFSFDDSNNIFTIRILF